MTLLNDIPGAPAAVGPYSQAVKCGDFLFCSGQIPLLPTSGKIEVQDVEGQTRQVFANIRAVLTGQGLGMSSIVKATVFLTDMADFPKINPIYATEMEGHRPARSTVQVSALPLGAKVEIEVIARV
jgi:2-iminobutanoate/2-iminopropanoate deaminase